MSFEYTVKTKKPLDKAIEDITNHLKDIGFGVLGVLDFKNILESKGLDFDTEYKQMEVCNPNLAKQVLDTSPSLGLLLPCTIALYQKDGENRISLAKPTTLLKMASENSLQFTGEEIEANLIKVIEKSK